MLKTLLIALCLTSIASIANAAFCPYPFVSSANGYNFNYCYYYAGTADSYSAAASTCASRGAALITPRDPYGQADLYSIYKAFSPSYFWVGATASASYPYYFYFQNGGQVDAGSYCSGHPRGGSNLCAFYTNSVLGKDKCIQTGSCSGVFFDHGVVCQYNGGAASSTRYPSGTTYYPGGTTYYPGGTTWWGKK